MSVVTMIAAPPTLRRKHWRHGGSFEGLVISLVLAPCPARAGADLSGLIPEHADEIALAVLVVLIGGPWVTSLWLLVRRASLTARRIGAVYALGSALFLLSALRAPLWALVVALPALLLAIGRSRFGELFCKTAKVWRMVVGSGRVSRP